MKATELILILTICRKKDHNCVIKSCKRGIVIAGNFGDLSYSNFKGFSGISCVNSFEVVIN